MWSRTYVLVCFSSACYVLPMPHKNRVDLAALARDIELLHVSRRRNLGSIPRQACLASLICLRVYKELSFVTSSRLVARRRRCICTVLIRAGNSIYVLFSYVVQTRGKYGAAPGWCLSAADLNRLRPRLWLLASSNDFVHLNEFAGT